MILALVAALLAQSPDKVQHPLDDYSALRPGRETRVVRAAGRPGGYAYAAYELAPRTGAGMGTVCACAAVTSAQGGAVTWTRASQGWCSKQGEAVTGIVEGDLVVCGNDLPRVEPRASGALSLRMESLRTNLMLRTEEFENAGWTKTVTATANTVLSPANGLTADTLDDTSGVSSQSAAQTYVIAGTNTYTGSVYLRAGTQTGARVQVSGSGGGSNTCTFTLSTTTWTRAICSASLTTNVTLTIYPGDDAADQGTIYAWGAQMETGAKATSYIQASAIAVTRQADTHSITTALAMVPSSWAVSVEGVHTLGGSRQLWVGINGDYVRGWINASGNWEADRATPTIAATNGTASATARLAGRYVTNGASATVQMCTDGSCGSVTTSSSTTPASSTANNFGFNSALGYYIDGLIGEICNDPDPARCL